MEVVGIPTIHYLTSGRRIDFPEGEEVNLLRVSIRNDCEVPFRCANGNCGTDRVFVVDGAHNLSDIRRKERERLGNELDEGYRLACQAYARGDVTIIWDPGSRPYMPETSRKKLKELWLAKADSD